ncbi:MAG TPA: DUF1232 domain-containing protein [Chthoniobacterales bacterium]|nr:DUF1232 domain-containing protein [Chthoniobacterales bacterium]
MPDPKRRTTRAAARSRRLPAKPKAAAPIDSLLQSKLEAELADALNSAKAYVRNPERLREFMTEVTRKALSLPTETFKGTLVYLHAILRLIRAYYRREYRAIPTTTLLILVAALIYLLDPLDLLPDWIPVVGFIDDAFVLTLAVRRTREAIDQFLAWESRRI